MLWVSRPVLGNSFSPACCGLGQVSLSIIITGTYYKISWSLLFTISCANWQIGYRNWISLMTPFCIREIDTADIQELQETNYKGQVNSPNFWYARSISNAIKGKLKRDKARYTHQYIKGRAKSMLCLVR